MHICLKDQQIYADNFQIREYSFIDNEIKLK